MSDRPLLTFALIAYNQERYVREAVAGALAQTYQPLEIILSDDDSSDRTFALMEEMAAAYDGPHRVRLNRNQPNLGLAGHVNRVMELAEGELIVAAAGDDISLPHRTERLYDAWKADPRAVFLYSDYEVLEGSTTRPSGFTPRPESHTPEAMAAHGGAKFPGCSEAWHRSVFRQFGPLLTEVQGEDRAIAFRATLLGELHYVPEPLVKYRRHPESISARYTHTPAMVAAEARRRSALKRRFRLALLRSFQHDLKTAAQHGITSSEQAGRLAATAQRTLRSEQLVIDSLVGSYWPRLLAAVRLLFRRVPSAPAGLRNRTKALLYALAPAVETWRQRSRPGAPQ